MSRRTALATDDPRPLVEIKFGGWHDGDNHKPYRGWYFVCRCGEVGLGQLLPENARRQWKKHAHRCDDVREEARAA